MNEFIAPPNMCIKTGVIFSLWNIDVWKIQKIKLYKEFNAMLILLLDNTYIRHFNHLHYSLIITETEFQNVRWSDFTTKNLWIYNWQFKFGMWFTVLGSSQYSLIVNIKTLYICLQFIIWIYKSKIYKANVSFKSLLTVFTPVTPVLSIFDVLWHTLNKWGWTSWKFVSNTKSRSDWFGILGTNSSLFMTSQM